MTEVEIARLLILISVIVISFFGGYAVRAFLGDGERR